MATLTIKFRENRINSRGECPVMLQLIHNRKQSEISLQIFVSPELWDANKSQVKRKHPKHGLLNAKIRNKYRVVEDIIASFEALNRPYSVKDITLEYKREIQGVGIDNHNIINYLSKYINDNPENLQLNSLKAYSNLISCLSEYKKTITFQNLSLEFFNDYEKYLTKKGKAINTISGRMKILRKAISLALRDGILDQNPMSGYKRKHEASKREYLTMEEVNLFEGYKAKTGGKQMVVDMFLFMCYTGLRFSDVCTLSQDEIKMEDENIKLHIRMNKTNELINFKLSKKAEAIFKKYHSIDTHFVFNILNENKGLKNERILKNEISNRNAYYNKTIKEAAVALEIPKNISMHIGRHTFATVSLGLGARIEVVSKLLGHRNIKETQIYAKIMDKSKDEAIDLWDKI